MGQGLLQAAQQRLVITWCVSLLQGQDMILGIGDSGLIEDAQQALPIGAADLLVVHYVAKVDVVEGVRDAQQLGHEARMRGLG